MSGAFYNDLSEVGAASFGATASAASTTKPTPSTGTGSRERLQAIEQTLDGYASHAVRREQAAQRILELTHAQ